MEKEPQNRSKPKKSSLAGPYNVLAEDLNNPEGEEEEDAPQSRRKHKRLSHYARTRLLSISMAKSFQVDDGNEEKAISHDSASKVFSTANSPMLVGSKIENSPALKPRSPLLSQYAESKHILRSFLMTDEQEKQDPKNQGQLRGRKDVLMTNLESTLTISKQTSLGLIAMKLDELDGANTPQLKHPNKEEVEKGNISGLDIPEIVEEGYKTNFSLTPENDEQLNHTACMICGLNKRNCVNQPCKHKVACYACMEQFKKDYGVCPRCKKFLTGLEKNSNFH